MCCGGSDPLTALTGGVTISRKDVPSRAAERVDRKAAHRGGRDAPEGLQLVDRMGRPPVRLGQAAVAVGTARRPRAALSPARAEPLRLRPRAARRAALR